MLAAYKLTVGACALQASTAGAAGGLLFNPLISLPSALAYHYVEFIVGIAREHNPATSSCTGFRSTLRPKDHDLPRPESRNHPPGPLPTHNPQPCFAHRYMEVRRRPQNSARYTLRASTRDNRASMAAASTPYSEGEASRA